MMSSPRKPSTPESPTTIPTFDSGIAMRISSAPRKTAGSKLTTASSMRPWRDRLLHPCHVNIACQTPREHANHEQDFPELAPVKTRQPITSEQEHRVLKFRPRTAVHPPGQRGELGVGKPAR